MAQKYKIFEKEIQINKKITILLKIKQERYFYFEIF